jgi:two-component system, LytTR family, response regulator
MSSAPVHALQVAIVDDEPLARYKIRALLEADEAVRIVGEASDCASAVALLDQQKPDLVFLDVQMPDGTGIDVLRAAHFSPIVVFTTAFDSYAIAAFEVGAADYLLKPFSRGRFQQAMDRARVAARSGAARDWGKRATGSGRQEREIVRLFVPTRAGTLLVDVADIEYFQGQGDYVQLNTKGRSHLVPITLKELEARLDSQVFLRVHRSFIVNIEFVDVIRSLGNGRACIAMKDGTEIRASRRGSPLLRERIRRA